MSIDRKEVKNFLQSHKDLFCVTHKNSGAIFQVHKQPNIQINTGDFIVSPTKHQTYLSLSQKP